MDDDPFSVLGVDPETLIRLLSQLLILGIPFTILCIWATARVTRNLTGSSRTFWILFIWIVPFLGPIFALIAARKPLPPPVPEASKKP